MLMAPERRPGAARAWRGSWRPILEVAPEVPVLVVHQGARPPSLPHHPNVSTVMLGRTMREILRPEMDRALLRVRIEQMRQLLAGKDRVGILLQDDPIRTRWPRASRSAPCSAAPGPRRRSCRSAA